MSDKEAMKLALEALESCDWNHGYNGDNQYFDDDKVDNAITSLRQALAKQEQGEPVAWRLESGQAVWFERTDPEASSALPNDVTAIPLYTTPYVLCSCGTATGRQQRTPLTDEQIEEIADGCLVDYRISAGCAWNFARDIEAAHGITSDTDFKE